MIQAYQHLLPNKKHTSGQNICKFCKQQLNQNIKPSYATPKYINTHKPLVHTSTLSKLEERLASLQIAFAQIWQLGHKRSQIGLTGTIINVPTYINIIQTTLPRSSDETWTVDVVLKRHLQYKNAYQKGRVRPNTVMNSLNELCKTILYKMQNVKLNKKWRDHLYPSQEEAPSSDSSSSDTDNKIDNAMEVETDTVIHGFIESRTIHSLQDKMIKITPTEGKQPLGIFQDKYAEEMNFLTLFFGEPRDEQI